MGVRYFVKRQITQIQQGGRAVLFRKINRAMRGLLPTLLILPTFTLAIPVVAVIRLLKPWFLVRIGGLISSRIGHFAANTELYLCEMDAGINVPRQRHVDIFCTPYLPICNQQLKTMWERVLCIWPAWILAPVIWVNRVVPGGAVHEVGNNTQSDRDVHNLLDRFLPHLQFTAEEEERGKAGLLGMGMPEGASFVCLIVRDSAYLNSLHTNPPDYSYHDYRDCNIQNFVLAAEELAERGYYVIRMGAKVSAAINSIHSKVIDYATNGMRSDFMDIYLGAKCSFCISVGTGFDAIPLVFRKPVVYANMVPLGYLFTFRDRFIGIVKHHFLVREDRELSLSEIFTYDVGFSLNTANFESKGIRLIENTPEEIRDVAIEMAERLTGTWQPREDDEALQKSFWEIFPTGAVDTLGKPLHGQIRGNFGAVFLRNNREWLA
jgi:putative glycosyltransferase (TIGR04372 family)